MKMDVILYIKLDKAQKNINNIDNGLGTLYSDLIAEGKENITNILGNAGKFSPSNSWLYLFGGSEYAVSDNVASFKATAQYGGIRTYDTFTVPAGHTLYVAGKIKGSTNTRLSLSISGGKFAHATGSGDFEFVSFTHTYTSQTSVYMQCADADTSGFETRYVKECVVVDLTETFGDVIPTKAQMDSFVSSVGFFSTYSLGEAMSKFFPGYINNGTGGYANLSEKTIVIMGDSITMQNTIDGSGNLTKARVNWADYAMPLLKNPTVYNFAQDGSSYHDFNNSGTYQTFTKQYNLMVSKGITPDVIIVALGTNDYQYTHTDDFATAMAVSSLDSLDKTNNYQSVRWAYWTLTQNYPNAVIIVSTPIPRKDMSLKNYGREAIVTMAEEYNINIIDAMLECGIARQYENIPGGAEGRYLADGLHPNTAGKKLLGRYWAHKISQLFTPDKFRPVL